eukprot:CAMPEP_0117445106 /NCGR_PEP_ID=MMETSP0759-20121206/5613_1 /TAXON_ID=63605 /ORGANISM="Percolomonas cosmopolitus, Strain WS" /LENGTH=397 /DNA_ID=CAMNT_0005237249 /DNA_START=41 /DNA_END=1234 /DNA_ORIENTATION=+
MAKKKSDTTKKVFSLGRVGTNLQVGIVGLPNVGKSTFFNAVTNSSIPAENFPFCTIDPNESRVAVPDERFDWLVEHWQPTSAVPAYLKIWDIAGLVKGAAEGAGLGNEFLSHIKACDALFHMVRAFENKEVTHTEGNVDPIRDIDIINTELAKKDIDFLTKTCNALERPSMGDKEKKKEFDVAKKALEALQGGKALRFEEWKAQEIPYLNRWQLLSAKPVIYLVNMSPKDYKDKTNTWYPKIEQYVEEQSEGIDKVVAFSAEMESKFAKLKKKKGEEALAEFCKQVNVQSALPKIITIGYDALNLLYYFTGGKKEVKAWTIPKGCKAPQAAGRIHSDFEDTFIHVEVMAFEDYKKCGSEAECKKNGVYRKEGKAYEVNDGEILLFKFGERTKSKNAK